MRCLRHLGGIDEFPDAVIVIRACHVVVVVVVVA
jgi:hypothetical protein